MTESRTNQVVVGVDGSPGSVVALQWAVAEAERRKAALVVVRATSGPRDWNEAQFSPIPPIAHQEFDALAADDLESTLEEMLGPEAARRVTRVVERGDAEEVLVGQAESARVLVVGRRGWHKGLFPGSTAEDVARHAACPVVIVPNEPPSEPGPEQGRVVVAVGETAHSAATLEFAFDEASFRGKGLTAVHVSNALPPDAASWRASAPDAALLREYQLDEQRALAEALAGWAEKYPDVEVQKDALPGDPVSTVIQASAGAALLVVGSHYRSRLRSLRLNSVAHSALHHATCPVAIIPAAAE
jgi:nucleotide-binding universal stress UspA family protein